jgi:predicted metal-binding protein
MIKLAHPEEEIVWHCQETDYCTVRVCIKANIDVEISRQFVNISQNLVITVQTDIFINYCSYSIVSNAEVGVPLIED